MFLGKRGRLTHVYLSTFESADPKACPPIGHLMGWLNGVARESAKVSFDREWKRWGHGGWTFLLRSSDVGEDPDYTMIINRDGGGPEIEGWENAPRDGTFDGNWSGNLEVEERSARVRLTLRGEPDALKGTLMLIPDSGEAPKEIPLPEVKRTPDGITFPLEQGSFRFGLVGKTLEGVGSGPGGIDPFPMTLKKRD